MNRDGRDMIFGVDSLFVYVLFTKKILATISDTRFSLRCLKFVYVKYLISNVKFKCFALGFVKINPISFKREE